MKNSLRERIELNEMRQTQLSIVRHAFIGLTKDELTTLSSIRNKEDEDVTVVDMIQMAKYSFKIGVAKMKLSN